MSFRVLAIVRESVKTCFKVCFILGNQIELFFKQIFEKKIILPTATPSSSSMPLDTLPAAAASTMSNESSGSMGSGSGNGSDNGTIEPPPTNPPKDKPKDKSIVVNS